MKPIKLKFDKEGIAETPFGNYVLATVDGCKWYWGFVFGGSEPYSSRESAIAAAQADFEERLGRCYGA
jgi:hypothetical protein